MKVQDLMTKSPACATPDQTLRDAATIMKQHDCGSLPVLDAKGRLIGVVTDRDMVVRAIATGRGSDTTVRDVMTKDPACCASDDDVELVQRIMSEKQVRRVPVVDKDGKTVGIVSQADLARAADGRGAVSERDLANVVESVSKEAIGTRH
jgi:CBS domain-containing protein